MSASLTRANTAANRSSSYGFPFSSSLYFPVSYQPTISRFLAYSLEATRPGWLYLHKVSREEANVPVSRSSILEAKRWDMPDLRDDKFFMIVSAGSQDRAL